MASNLRQSDFARVSEEASKLVDAEIKAAKEAVTVRSGEVMQFIRTIAVMVWVPFLVTEAIALGAVAADSTSIGLAVGLGLVFMTLAGWLLGFTFLRSGFEGASLQGAS